MQPLTGGDIMEIFIRIILIFATVSFVGFLAGIENKSPKNRDIIRLPKVYLVVGIVCLLFFVGVLVALLISQNSSFEDKITFYGMLVFMLLPLSILIAYFNWKIEIVGNEFIYQTFFRKKYRFKLKEAWIKSSSQNIIVVVVGKKKLYINPHAISIQNFENIIKYNKPH